MVGIGPGDPDHLTFKAYGALREAEVVVGYHRYVELVRTLLEPRQEIIASGMGQEIQRCRRAVELAQAGREVALISSGDPGVYGMAGLALELLHQERQPHQVPVEIIPGVTAASAAAANLGAPLMQDFAVISLSDLLIPWPVIEERVQGAARAGLVLVLYNPQSKTRRQGIRRVQEILLEHRQPSTPVGIVRNSFREGQEVILTTLDTFTDRPLDMLSLVIIGSKDTSILGPYLVTARGYQL